MTTKIKFCGLTRPCDIEAVNELRPDYIGFVFAKKSRRYVTPETAGELKKLLDPSIPAVGVFVNETVETVAQLLNEGIIDIAQLHGNEDEDYIRRLRTFTGKPVIKAYKLENVSVAAETVPTNILNTALSCSADHILLDSGAGCGITFNWELLKGFTKPYFLAGGLSPENAEEAVKMLHPFALDVSSGIETDGVKDNAKMAAFIAAVKRGEQT
ncbi:MAG: phosphoribosylanthranilate isomerase [Lachnospiraceae bacterium]|nr:phosphoribosylanthranilate isomerase [Lachnospiraceae bacterium]